MVDLVLAAHPQPAVRTGIRIIARAEHARARQIVREQVAQLVHAVARRCPPLPAVHVLSQYPSRLWAATILGV